MSKIFLDKKIRIWIFLLMLVLLAPVIAYMFFFRNYNISTNHGDWAIFANYFTGIVGPIFLLFNILALVILTYQVAEFNKKNTISQIKHSLIMIISLYLFSINDILLDVQQSKPRIHKLRNDINSFCKTYNRVFSDVDLITYQGRLDQILKKCIDQGWNANSINQFDEIRYNLLQELQNSMLT